ncbi:MULTISPECIES: cupin domain-containing protein [Pseudomonas]|jgi:mannose-6-phosphate isomerase-like protein (cupin superfamily)|uniref:cupin domain-containing protein n=1 Tax=Pseudomonas TaxID=286 RepID=UPI000811E12A|nr:MULTISPECIES: cupin domain-containing protein [Pseudomonas]MDO4237005.1 cupin domain-containing protein [Pseudomonas sp.]RZI24660.1 cupin domain-containing protein [Pseudomonas orientalis]CRL98427.1 mannose-1-phosphate guanylyltransferase/mannose-6-phosphate isomerase [Pseudomonas sp. 28 E 9]
MNDIPKDNALPIESYIRRYKDMTFTHEYNCNLRRLFPWPGNVNTKRPMTEFGCIWVQVEPGTEVDRHAHDEEESFIVIAGQAELSIESDSTTITFGDVIYLPRHSQHQLRNHSKEAFVMLDIYWDWGGQSDSSL